MPKSMKQAAADAQLVRNYEAQSREVVLCFGAVRLHALILAHFRAISKRCAIVLDMGLCDCVGSHT